MTRRFSLLAAPLLALSAVAGPFASASYAAVSSCAAVGDVPHLIPNRSGIHSSGTFRCLDAAPGMTITVCIEEQIGTGTWWQRGCASKTAGEATDTVDQTVTVSVMVYSTLLRTTVSGHNDTGATASYKSPPIFWFNCACYIG
jgi:hypothetical protein